MILRDPLSPSSSNIHTVTALKGRTLVLISWECPHDYSEHVLTDYLTFKIKLIGASKGYNSFLFNLISSTEQGGMRL